MYDVRTLQGRSDWVFTHHILKVEMMTSWEHDEIIYMVLPSME
jgi:hypothetical protein